MSELDPNKTFQLYNGSLYHTIDGEIDYELVHPAACFMIDGGLVMLLRLSEKDAVQEYYQKQYAKMQKAGLMGFRENNGLFIMDLPRDVDTLNAILASPDHLKVLLRALYQKQMKG